MGTEEEEEEEACTDDETKELIQSEKVATSSCIGVRTGKAALVLGLAIGAAVLVWSSASSPGCELDDALRPSDISSAVGFAERRETADERVRAIVKVLDVKPKQEVDALVQKAMHTAGEESRAKHRELASKKTFNQVLANKDSECTIERPEVKHGAGTYLGHDHKASVYLDSSDGGPQQWQIGPVGKPDEYVVKATVPAKSGSFLAHYSGFKVGISGSAKNQMWRIRPAKSKEYRGLYTIQVVQGFQGEPYLGRKGSSQVLLTDKAGSDEMWKIPCLARRSARQAQRKATCAFNIIYATQYVARASLTIQAAARTCPNARGFRNKVCALNSLVIVSSFSNLAVALADAASSCAESTNVRAICAGGVMELVSSLSTIGAGGLITASACKPGQTVQALRLPSGADSANPGGPAFLGRRLFLGGGKANFMAQCVLDATQVAWSLGSVGIAITAAVRDSCPFVVQGTGILKGLSQSACAMDIGAVIYAFGRIAQFLAFAMIHCTDELNLQALCAGGVSALISAAAALVVTGNAFYLGCDQGIKLDDMGGALPGRIGAAAEAGLLQRRLASQGLAEGAKDADVHKVAKDLGYNLSGTLEPPTFKDLDSAIKVLESFDRLQADKFGVAEASLKKSFKSVEDLWRHVGLNASDLLQAESAQPDQSERFVRLMEPVLSAEDKARVDAAMEPSLFQKWQRFSARGRCL